MELPDGTLVWLNAGSSLTYSQGFGVDERRASLIGEGYFEVTENPKIPFCIKTGEMYVKVLGTKFNFSNYPNDEEAVVSLIEGKVQVDNLLAKKDRMEILPNQKVLLNKKTRIMRKWKQNARLAAAWTNGLLLFDEILLPDIVKTLERNYDVHIRLADPSLKSFRFYGEFIYREQSIRDILDILSATNKIRYSMAGKEITILPVAK
jgi:ferric-dicitrate binding protein FerR (iron transport regulator)